VIDIIKNLELEIIPHPYSPDIAPSDFHMLVRKVLQNLCKCETGGAFLVSKPYETVLL
jgi:hypothetical protein